MKLSSGSVVINRDIASVYKYCCSFSNFIEEQQAWDLEGYTLELDDEINDPVREGDEVTIYAYTKFEKGCDWIMDLEILKLSENNFITYKIKRIAAYEDEHSEYKDVKPLPFSLAWKNLEFGIIFYDLQGSTRIDFVNYIKPSSSIMFKLLAYVLHLFGFFKNDTLMNKWAAVVQNNA